MFSIHSGECFIGLTKCFTMRSLSFIFCLYWPDFLALITLKWSPRSRPALHVENEELNNLIFTSSELLKWQGKNNKKTVFSYLSKVLFSGFLHFKGNFVDGRNNSKCGVT